MNSHLYAVMFKVTLRSGDVETVYFMAAVSARSAVERAEDIHGSPIDNYGVVPVSANDEPYRAYSINTKTGEMS